MQHGTFHNEVPIPARRDSTCREGEREREMAGERGIYTVKIGSIRQREDPMRGRVVKKFEEGTIFS